MPSADQAATHRRSVRLLKLLGTLGDGARTASEEAATDSKKRQFNGANVATFSKKTYSKLNSTTDLVIRLLEASAGEGEHLEVETTADEDLVCPIHLKRPSQCPQGVCPAPLLYCQDLDVSCIFRVTDRVVRVLNREAYE